MDPIPQEFLFPGGPREVSSTINLRTVLLFAVIGQAVVILYAAQYTGSQFPDT
jgi:hypothetical protein